MKIATQHSFFVSTLLSLLTGQLLFARNIHRPVDPQLPYINVRWAGESIYEQLRHSHLEHHTIFGTYDDAYFHDHLLPSGTLTFRDKPQQSVTTALLDKLIETLLQEVREQKKKYTHFVLLQNKDFNHKKACGLLVVRFKQFPFVVKLFIETPHSFTRPACKGPEPVFFFYMSGGINRHLLGFTRIKNLEHINKRLEEHPEWDDYIKTPRKWFWLPHQQDWMEIEGTNMGPKAYTKIPGTYAIIADAITAEQKFSLYNPHNRKEALILCNYLDLYVDPHIDNFMIEQGSEKIAIVDTEHFPSVVGFKERRRIVSYVDWYAQLVCKCIKDIMFYPKNSARYAQKSELALP